jgi:tripartite-type tricarboxylate transporter receptor subunit TctC
MTSIKMNLHKHFKEKICTANGLMSGVRQLIVVVFMSGACSLALCAGTGFDSAAFTKQPFKIVVPFGAGGVADLTARVVAQALSERLGQAVVIDNKPGAGGIVAADLVAKSEPDGHTLFLMSNGTAVSAGLFKSLPYDTLKDFTPISLLATFDMAIVAADNSRFKSLNELISFAKSHPGQLNIGSVNIGSTQNLAAELFKSTAGIDAQVVPFNGTPAVITALRGGQIDAAVEILAPVISQINSHSLKALAITSDKRSAALPDVPTAVELHVKGMIATSWNGLSAPAKTPPEAIERLNKEIVEVLKNPAVRQKLLNINVEPKPTTPAQAQEWLKAEMKTWAQVIDKAGIEKQ